MRRTSAVARSTARPALAASDVRVVEVHISDVSAREDFRQVNVLEGIPAHSVIGKGWVGYLDALDWLIAAR